MIMCMLEEEMVDLFRCIWLLTLDKTCDLTTVLLLFMETRGILHFSDSRKHCSGLSKRIVKKMCLKLIALISLGLTYVVSVFSLSSSVIKLEQEVI